MSMYTVSPGLPAEIENLQLTLSEHYASGSPDMKQIARMEYRLLHLRSRENFDYRVPSNWVRLAFGLCLAVALWQIAAAVLQP